MFTVISVKRHCADSEVFICPTKRGGWIANTRVKQSKGNFQEKIMEKEQSRVSKPGWKCAGLRPVIILPIVELCLRDRQFSGSDWNRWLCCTNFTVTDDEVCVMLVCEKEANRKLTTVILSKDQKYFDDHYKRCFFFSFWENFKFLSALFGANWRCWFGDRHFAPLRVAEKPLRWSESLLTLNIDQPWTLVSFFFQLLIRY